MEGGNGIFASAPQLTTHTNKLIPAASAHEIILAFLPREGVAAGALRPREGGMEQRLGGRGRNLCRLGWIVVPGVEKPPGGVSHPGKIPQ
jgi:hypothetical protein